MDTDKEDGKRMAKQKNETKEKNNRMDKKRTAEMSVRNICITSVCIALICVATMVIQIPIPLGYVHLGDCIILLSSVFFGPVIGMLSAGIGSAMADGLTGWAIWVIPTLLIKGFMGWIVGRIAIDEKQQCRIFSIRTAIAVITGLLIMVAGYVIVGGILYGSMEAGLASATGLIAKAVVNGIVFFVLAGMLEAAHIRKWMR